MNNNTSQKLIAKEGIISYDPMCVRKKSNWSKISSQFKFDNEEFNPSALFEKIPHYSPKLATLLKKINDLDKSDMKKHGKLFKHFIFSDLKSGAYGAKMLCSGLIASGMNLGYTSKNLSGNFKSTGGSPDEDQVISNSRTPSIPDDDEDDDDDDDDGGSNKPAKNSKKYGKIELFPDEKLLKTKKKNIYLLSSVSVYDQPITTDIKKKILAKFNQRPENIYGDLVRIIIMDSGYKEGIDLFDIKYVHIFEPSTVAADQKQVIGRGTRTCGQRGLDFHPKRGWPLYVHVYDLSIPEPLQAGFLGMKTAIDLYLKSMNFDFRLFRFINELEKYSIIGAVDYELNKLVHSFSVPIGDEDADDTDDKPHNQGSVPIQNMYGGREKNNVEKHTMLVVPRRNLMGHEKMKEFINTYFSQYSWKDIKMENLCGTTKGGSQIMNYTPTQDFIRNYFTPSTPVNGMLLHHSVGTGKTCSAIAAATSSFEAQGYTILWVTRTTLKNDIWKNMFDQICNESIANKIREQGLEIPADSGKRMRLLSQSWRIRPMSYKQFSNLVSKSNQYYQELVKINGSIDPLRKTLLIIDEAHKLYGGGDLSSIERPDMDAFHKALMTSYEVSGSESVKLLLMTATPITESPMELIKIVNLCKPIAEQMPTDFEEFSSMYLNKEGTFTENGKDRFLDEIAGYISYLNRERDARQFSQPQIQYIQTPIADVEDVKKYDKKYLKEVIGSERDKLKEEMEEIKATTEKDVAELSGINKSALSNAFKREFCPSHSGSDSSSDSPSNKNKKKCQMKTINSTITLILKEIKDVLGEIKQSSKDRITKIKEKIKEMKKKQEIEKDEEYNNETYYVMKTKCAIKIPTIPINGKNKTKKVDPKTMTNEIMELLRKHPDVVVYDKRIEHYKHKIQNLENQFQIEIKKKQGQINIWEDLLSKKYLSDTERENIQQNIENAKGDNSDFAKELKDTLNEAKNEILNEIHHTEHAQANKLQEMKNITMKKMRDDAADEKKKEKDDIINKKKDAKLAEKEAKLAEKTRKKEAKLAEKEAKKLRKTQKNKGVSDSVISKLDNPKIIKIIDKYKDKMNDDFQHFIIDERLKEQQKADKKVTDAEAKKLKQKTKETDAEAKKQAKEVEAEAKKWAKEVEAEAKKRQKEAEADAKKRQKEADAEAKKLAKEANKGTRKEQRK
jgi:hypothetical protein